MKTFVEELQTTYDAFLAFTGADIRDFLREQEERIVALGIDRNAFVGLEPEAYEDVELKAQYVLGQLIGSADGNAPPMGRMMLMQTFERFALAVFTDAKFKKIIKHAEDTV